ncbi:MAG: phosphatase PAP2 family protein, partial [Bacteroidota bacterium]
IFDSIRIIPNYEINPPLHIAEPYLAEKSWFGIETPDGILTPNEYIEKNYTNTFLDIYTAIIYISWIPIPLTFSFYLFFSKQRQKMVHYLFGFLMVSQLGLVVQFIYPAAPPWYVDQYGFEEHLSIPGNPGRLIEFDKYFGTSLFESMYGLNANVFAAIPSLHCAFPIILIFFSWKYQLRGWMILGIVLMLSTWFSAVYTYHHYIIDVILGVLTALMTVLIYRLLMKTKVKDWLDRYGQVVS